jgi:hypothetical protein
MVCPQVVDGTDDLQIWRMEGICEYIEWSVADSWQGMVFGLGDGLTVPHHKKLAGYEMSHLCNYEQLYLVLLHNVIKCSSVSKMHPS